MKSILFSACLIASILVSAGCGKMNQKNYNRLKIGMPYSEVVSILGEADNCSSSVGLKNCTWGDEKKYINIRFAGQKVVFFSAQGLK
ncbi:MAG: DUF3862 domain-containing protein [Desulfobacteraceae bacterium]|nr:MAG: DUF3862 domain-containing protein [Desulfobacteraceae bacterium]